MAQEGMQTYCKGFDFKPLRTITKADFIRIVNRLNGVFGDGWVFEPEAISEGGIVIKNWPGKTREMYKSMRFFYRDPKTGQFSWPTVTLEYYQEWEQSDDIVWSPLSLRPRKDWCVTRLKAFRFAPPWTVQELRKIETVLNDFGIVTRKIPSQRSLHYNPGAH